MTAAPALPRQLTAPQVAARLGIEASDVMYLPSYRIGRQTFYDMTELEAWTRTPTGRSLLTILRTKSSGTPWWRCVPIRPRSEPTP